MGEKIVLSLDKRELHGKKVARLRGEGLVPAIIYGAGFEPIAVQAGQQIIDKVVSRAGKHHPINVTIGDAHKIAMIKSIDVDPVKHRVRHVAFHAVKQNEKVVAEVPIKLIGEGESLAERAGLVVLQTLEVVELKALPNDLPDALEASIINVADAGQSVTLADVTLPDGVEYADIDQDLSLVIASAYEPGALQAANEATAGEAENPADVAADNGGDTDQEAQNPDESTGKKQSEDKGN